MTTHPSPSILDQIEAARGSIDTLRSSNTHSFSEHQGQMTDPIVARDIAGLEAALETLRRVEMGS